MVEMSEKMSVPDRKWLKENNYKLICLPLDNFSLLGVKVEK